MLAYQIFFTMFAISIPMVTLVVAGRHLWAMAQSLRAKKFILSFFSLLAVVSMAGLFVAVGAVWFGYGGVAVPFQQTCAGTENSPG